MIDSFRLFKVKDLLPLSDKEVPAFLGKASFISSSPMDLLFLPHIFPFDVFTDKMIDLSVKEQKKLMAAACDTRKGTRGPLESKYDLTGLELRALKKRK